MTTNKEKLDQVINKVPLIYSKVADAMHDIEAIGKNQKNQQQGFKYRGIDDVYNDLHAIFARHRIFTTTEIVDERSEERTTSKGSLLLYRILKVKYTMYAEDGSSIYGIIVGEGMDSGDKASNKAMAIAHKYFLTQLFIIPTSEAKDPDGESYELKVPKVRASTNSALPLSGSKRNYHDEWKQNANKIRSAAFIEQIDHAVDIDTLKNVWTDVIEAKKNGELNTYAYTQLETAKNEKKMMLTLDTEDVPQ